MAESKTPKPLVAWTLVRAGRIIVDADGVVPVFRSEKVARENAGAGAGGSDGETPVKVRIVPVGR